MPAIPTIHLNGTSQEELLSNLVSAIAGMRHAQELVARTAPNGRDYYPQGTDAIRQATDGHERRMRDLQAIVRELIEIAEAIT